MDAEQGSVGGRSPLKQHDVAHDLRRAILEGALPSGALLPGEHDLAARYSVSRGTVRRALEGLARDRLIETRSGVGSFVTFDGRELVDPGAWGRALSHDDVAIDTEVLRLERLVDPELAAEVRTDSMEFVAVDRLRRLRGGRAVSLERSRVPSVGRLAEAPERGLVDGSLSTTLAEAGLRPARGEQWIAAAPLSSADASVLQRDPGEVFLTSIRLARTREGAFVEKVVSWLDPTRFRVHQRFGETS